MTSNVVREALLNATREAWNAGYHEAIAALRSLSDEFADEQAKLAIRTAADVIEQLAPKPIDGPQPTEEELR